MQTDNIEREGRLAFERGLGESNCPYNDCTNRLAEVGYWETDAGKRQRWMHGFLLRAQNNEVGMQR